MKRRSVKSEWRSYVKDPDRWRSVMTGEGWEATVELYNGVITARVIFGGDESLNFLTTLCKIDIPSTGDIAYDFRFLEAKIDECIGNNANRLLSIGTKIRNAGIPEELYSRLDEKKLSEKTLWYIGRQKPI